MTHPQPYPNNFSNLRCSDKQEKTTFIPKYFEMLSLGGSKKPSQIAAIAGLDIEKPDFWKGGVRLLEELVEEAEKLTSPIPTRSG